MFFVILGAVFAVIGNGAIRKSNLSGDRTGIVSVGGYIAYIISFALVEFGLNNASTLVVFGIWGAFCTLLNSAVGIFIFHEQFSPSKIIFSLMIFIGAIGLTF